MLNNTIGIAPIVCGAGSMKRHSVRPSVRPAADLLLWTRRAGDIDCCSSGGRMRAVSQVHDPLFISFTLFLKRPEFKGYQIATKLAR